MRRLLRAHLVRIWKNGLFWLCAGAMALCGALVCASHYRTMLQYPAEHFALEDVFFFSCPLIGLFMAGLLNLFLGMEYSDGTMHNKLMVGHQRSAIYGASLIAGWAMTGLILLCGALSVLALGLPMFGFFQMERTKLIWMLVSALALGVSTASICVALAMNIQNRAVAVVAAMVLVVLMLFASSYIASRLDEPEMISEGLYFQNGKLIEQGEAFANPKYLTGSARTVLETIFELLPTGQGARLSNLDTRHVERFPWYSLLLSAAVSALGYGLYRKKDIR